MPERVDLRPVARAARRMGCRRNGAVVAEAQDLAAQARRVPGDVAGVSAGRHVHLAVAAERDAAVQSACLRTRRARAGRGRQERAAFEAASCERRRPFAVLDRLCVRGVHQPVLGEPGMERDVHQPAVAVRPDARHTRNRLSGRARRCDDAQPAGPFGDQHGPIGEKRDRPRMREPLGDDADADLVLFGRIEHKRSRAERRHRHADLLLRVADSHDAEQYERDRTKEGADRHATLQMNVCSSRVYGGAPSSIDAQRRAGLAFVVTPQWAYMRVGHLYHGPVFVRLPVRQSSSGTLRPCDPRDPCV